MDDPVIAELSDRCHRLLVCRPFIVQPINSSPYREHKVGRVLLCERDTFLSVFLYRILNFVFTTDMVYTEIDGRHTYSSWPLVYDTLSILRIEMVLDDLSSA